MSGIILEKGKRRQERLQRNKYQIQYVENK
jgi:hypothetical protein